MRDLFDDFLRELNDRQKGKAAGAPGPEAGVDRPSGNPEPEQAGAEDGSPEQVDEATPAGTRAEAEASEETTPEAEAADGAATEAGPPDEEPSDAEPTEEPIVIPTARRGRGRRRGGGNRPPGGTPGGPNDGGSWRHRVGALGPQVLLVVVGLILFAVVFLLGAGLDLATDAIWYKSVGFDPVFWSRLGAQFWLFIGGLVAAIVFLLGNLWLAGRLAPPPDDAARKRMRGFVGRLGDAARATTEGQLGRTDPFGFPRRGPTGRPGDDALPPRPTITFQADEMPDLSPLAIGGLVVIAVLAAVGMAGALSGSWDTILLWQNRVPFAVAGAPAVVDPVFGRDVSYYLFELPFLRLVQAVVGGLLIAALVVAGGRYLLAGARGGGFPTPVRVHLGVLGGLYLLTVAAGYQLDKLSLVYSTRGFATGVSYTDQAAQFFAFDALTIVAGLVAALLVGGAFTRWIWPLGAGIAVWFGLSILLGQVYPEVIQRFTVEPNQYAQEAPYIANNIGMTRLAFNLTNWEDKSYAGDQPLTASDLIKEASTFKNARLWDYRPLQKTLDQLQTVRQYYDFYDVDVDRYTIGGETRQVMLSARELAPERNPQAGSWVNQRIVFTHGFGLTMVPVNEVDPQGLPQFFIRDMPPQSAQGAPTVSQPRIYFGERPSDWVVVGARQAEFDYPIGSGDGTDGSGSQETTHWTGTSGIKLDSILSRLLFAARFRDLNLLISDQVTAESQLLMHRSLGDRLGRIAPFLAYDKDPYSVVDDQGRLVWIQDAYTLTDRFPNAQEFAGSNLGETSGLAGRQFNYLRNSVKIVMDAYDGTMTFYVADPNDPLIRAWEGVFPTLFRPLSDLPTGLRAHLRVPEELFNVQTRLFASYHVTDPLTFFQGDDLWTVPQITTTDTGQLPLEAYYVYMRMPGEATPEFLLLQPMVPKERPNMIAWVAARSDGDAYGGVRVYRFPRDTSIFGPVQIEARIDQDPQISSQVTLWNQSGSQVVRGNLIVVPVQDSIIYLEPIYLQSTGSAIPEFTKIVVASPTKVVWGDTLEEALKLLLAGGPGPSPGPSPTPGPSLPPGASPTPSTTPGPNVTPAPGDVQALVEYANAHFEAAQAALRQGDFATYGAEMAEVQKTLAQLGVVVGGSPTPAP
jgi:uncharacterized membrane protein (UPF0182 family)